jgi:hypothetical protein
MPEASMAARLGRLEDERAIMELLARYCQTIDRGQTADWVDCFTEDGAFVVVDAGGREKLAVRGWGALVAYVEDLMTSVPPGSQDHITLNSAIALEGDAATVESYYITVALGDDGPRIRSRGRYRDEVRRTARGWRFHERLATSMRTPA